MKNNDLAKTIAEFKEAGASKNEAEELSLLSKNISNLLKIERSETVKNKFLDSLLEREQIRQPFFRKWLVVPILAVLCLAFLGSYTIARAQQSLPGQPLYPVKILSENIAATVVPSFKGEILQRRSEEIKTLSEQNNSQNPQNLQKTINSYEKTLQQDGGISANSLDESRKNLIDASKSASLENKKEIENIIRQTDNSRKDMHESSPAVQEQIQNKVNSDNPLEH